MRRASTKIWITLATSAVALCVAAGASAYFPASGAGVAMAGAAGLAGPSSVAASSGTGAVSVSWTAPTPPGGGSVAGYYVQRFKGSTPTAACGSSAASLLSPSSTTCTDTGNPSGAGVPAGSYTYEVVAIWRSWSTPSAPSGTVSVAGPATAAANPASADQGATNLGVTITGSNFISGATASFSGSGITVNSISYVSPTQLTANITISPTAATGARNITVTNPDGDVATAAAAFTVNAAPTVSSLSPGSRGQGASSQTITITGTGFDSGSALAAAFSGTGITVNSISNVSPTQLTADITIAGTATTGSRNFTVTNGDGSAATGTEVFTVNAGPTVTSTSPNSADEGASNYNVTITGTGFVSGATVSFSGSGITLNSPATYVSATRLTANVSISATADTGARSVTVTNPDAGGGTGTGVFTVNPAPTVSSLNPASADQGASNYNVTITGTNFVSGATVVASGGGVTFSSPTVVSATQLTAKVTITAGAATGARNITLTNGDGSTASVTAAFTVNPAPTVTSASPAELTQGQASQAIAITGTGFESGASVSFSGSGITATTTYNSSTSLTATVTTGVTATTGPVNITVTNPDSSTATCSGCMHVFGFTDAAQGTATSGKSVTSASFTLSASNTYLVLVSSKSSSGDTATPGYTSFTSNPTAAPIGSIENYNGNVSHNWAWSLTGGSGTGKVKITLNNATSQAYIDVIAITGANATTPVVNGTVGAATGGSNATATAALSGTPAAGDAEVLFWSGSAAGGASAPASSLSQITAITGSYGTASGGAVAAYAGAAGASTDSLTLNGLQYWGTGAIELNHS